MIEQFENKIINADCLDILKQLPDKCIDLVLTDPPYGIDVIDSHYDGRIKRSNNCCAESGQYKKSDWDKKIPTREIFEQIFRVSKNQIIFGGNYFIEYLHNSNCWIVWDKLNGSNCFADCELAWTSFKTAVRKYEFLWSGMLQQNMQKKEKRIHPTQKPADLFGQILRDYSKENDLVLDCFSGSGTTAVACHNLKRRFICIEKDKDYYELSLKRLKEHQRQQMLF